MRIARVIGTLTLSPRLPELQRGRLLICDALDHHALAELGEDIYDSRPVPRAAPMPESLVVYDELGAGVGQLIALSEGREAAMPFYPVDVPVDAYNAAILDEIQLTPAQQEAVA